MVHTLFLLRDGYSPLHKAVKSDCTIISKYFAQNEADIKAKDIDGFDALEFALNIKKQDA